MTVPHEIVNLIERFDGNAEEYRSGQYNETQLRRDFVDPFFEALGWDINNTQGLSERFRHVIHEDAIKIGGHTKAPDYGFYVGETRMFFVEAKKPSVNVKHDVAAAFQLRRYGWSAKLPLSILTNFDEYAVYDCRALKPVNTDRASTARLMYFGYQEYAERWDEIASIFSRGAVQKGAFDKYAAQTKGRRGTAEVDDAFLEEIESWRKALASNIYLRNPHLTTRDLNFSVGIIIDRIIFLRICEDRGIEPDEQLKQLIGSRDIYQQLLGIFYRADQKYNSGLFHFDQEKVRAESPDTLTPSLSIDDRVLKDIFKTIYLPLSPYAFLYFPPEILGQVYEQFLGKVIHLTAHRAVIDDKPEVRKAGGVYYTPSYIVDYIVKQTVGQLCEGKTAKQVDRLRILDPACGSGSFLINAYQYLLDWYLDWYVRDGAEKHHKQLTQGPRGEWRLATAEKRRILLQNIYGVDIDSQAVEVTKLSLLLKVLEGESERSLAKQISLLHERALPDLGSNIKCGNSLIGPDFYDLPKMNELSDEEQDRINVFNWKTEFAEVMRVGGFDAVIGNPPYIFTREQLSKAERQYFSAKYKASWEKQNTFMLFMEAMLQLINVSGEGAYIVPNSWLTIESAHLLRGIFIPHLRIIADLNYMVFNRVSMEPCVFVISGGELRDPVLVWRAESKEQFNATKSFLVKRERWGGPSKRIVFSQSADSTNIIDRVVDESQSIGSVFDVRTGLQAYERGKGNPRQTAEDVAKHIFDRDSWEDAHSYRYLQGGDVGRYHLKWSCMWMQYGPWLSQPREISIFARPRILIREITSNFPYCLNATYLTDTYLNNKSVLNILHPEDNTEELRCLLGILNSRIISLFYKQRAVKSARKIFPKIVIRNVREFPYPDTIDNSKRSRLVQVVDRMLALHKQMASVLTDQERTMIQRRIDATDTQIDALVYELYGLTEDEIKIVEASTQ